MKTEGREQSSNVEDRTSRGGGGFGGGFGRGGGLGSNPFGNGGGVRIPVGRGGGLGGIGIIIVIFIIAMVLGINPLTLLNGGSGGSLIGSDNYPAPNADDQALKDFTAVVLRDTEVFWGNYFEQHGDTYQAPKLVMFSGQTDSACGTADSGSGPFYCPNDQKVYIDLSFYRQLHDQLGAPGDFAQAYVIAHEVGHHVQNLIGVLPEFNRQRQAMSQTQANEYSVRIELMADCLAGMWAKGEFEAGYLESGDNEEAINAANQIGDDRLTGGRIPSSQYTHGTAQQRQAWLKRGMASTDITACDTINQSI
jgi:predicted metalloprotease